MSIHFSFGDHNGYTCLPTAEDLSTQSLTIKGGTVSQIDEQADASKSVIRINFTSKLEAVERDPLNQSIKNNGGSAAPLDLRDAEEELVKNFCINLKELKAQCSLAGPLIVGNLLSFCLQLISVTFVGHFGELELSGASIANSVAAVTGFSVVLGMGSALETLCGQAYGARQYRKLGVYLQRAIIVLNVTAIPLVFIWASIDKILIFLGQDAQIAHTAGKYCRWLIPTLFGSATGQPFTKFLQAQSLVTPLLVVSLATLLCHVPICWLMVYKSGMGYEGAAIANSISYWIDVLFLFIYVRFSSKCERSRAKLSWEAFNDMKGFLLLAIPSAAMICLEWWSYEVLVILSGLLPNPELSTSSVSICLNTESLIFMLPLGLSAAASTRVSNELGAGHPLAARGAVTSALLLALSEALVVSVILLLIRHVWGHVYSSEQEVIDAVDCLAPFLSVSTFCDSLQAALSGVARGAGWQKVGAIINLGSFYVVGLPIACVLAFATDLRAKGLLLGLIIGCCTQGLAFSVITYLTDWEKEAEKVAVGVASASSLTNLLLIE